MYISDAVVPGSDARHPPGCNDTRAGCIYLDVKIPGTDVKHPGADTQS